MMPPAQETARRSVHKMSVQAPKGEKSQSVIMAAAQEHLSESAAIR